METNVEGPHPLRRTKTEDTGGPPRTLVDRRGLREGTLGKGKGPLEEFYGGETLGTLCVFVETKRFEMFTSLQSVGDIKKKCTKVYILSLIRIQVPFFFLLRCRQTVTGFLYKRKVRVKR